MPVPIMKYACTGVLVAVKRNLGCNVKHIQKIDGHAICLGLDIETTTEEIHVISIYAPNDTGQRSKFFETVSQWFCSGQMILLGGFNSIIDSQDRKSGALDQTSEQLAKLLVAGGMIEPSGVRVFTYQHPSVENRKSRIDCIYVSKCLKDECFIYTQWCQCSDHSAVVLEWNQKQGDPHSGDFLKMFYWMSLFVEN